MPFGWERPSHYLRTICISVRRTHLELSPTVVHRVHDADDAHHGESSDRRSSKKAFLRTKAEAADRCRESGPWRIGGDWAQ